MRQAVHSGASQGSPERRGWLLDGLKRTGDLSLRDRVYDALMHLRYTPRLLRVAGLPTLRPLALRAEPSGITFDVFDTLLTRVVEPAEAVWLEVGRRAADEQVIGVSGEQFAMERRSAAWDLRSTGVPPILEEVHEIVGKRLRIPPTHRARLVDLELRVEAEHIEVIPQGRSLLQAARDITSEQRIIFVSDMHLPSPFIRERLKEHQCWKEGDRLWVSGEARARKKDVSLFRLVREYELPPKAHFVHVGDNLLADCVAPRWAGFGARPFIEALPNRHERCLAPDTGTSDCVSPLLSGSARLTRLELASTEASPELAALRRVAVDVAGPFLVCYCLWLLRRALEENIERLYFLSRDGEVLCAVTKALARAVGVTVDLRYLQGGRLAWQRPAIAVGASNREIEALARKILFGYTLVRPSGVAERLGLSLSFVHSVLERPSSERERDDSPLTSQERDQLHAALTTDQGLCSIRKAAAESLPETLAFLEQEGLLEETRWALVDVGWRGNTVRSLNALLRSKGRSEARVFFIGYLGPGGIERLPSCEAFLWDTDHAQPLPQPPGAVSIVEALCSGSHGPVAGYARCDGRVQAVLATKRGQASQGWWLDDLRFALDDYLHRLTPHLRLAHLATARPRDALSVLTELCERPTKTEAIALGSCPREEDAQGQSVFPLARRFHLTDLPGLVRRGPAIGRNLGWKTGALVLTPQPTRSVVELVLAMRDSVRGLSK